MRLLMTSDSEMKKHCMIMSGIIISAAQQIIKRKFYLLKNENIQKPIKNADFFSARKIFCKKCIFECKDLPFSDSI